MFSTCGRDGPHRSRLPTITALFVSSAAAYLPIMLFGDSLSQTQEIIISSVIGTVAYALTLWYMKRLRDGT